VKKKEVKSRVFYEKKSLFGVKFRSFLQDSLVNFFETFFMFFRKKHEKRRKTVY